MGEVTCCHAELAQRGWTDRLHGFYLVLRLVRVGPSVASEKVSSFQSTDDSRVKGSRVNRLLLGRGFKGSVHSKVGR